jgi:hypothetical protein
MKIVSFSSWSISMNNRNYQRMSQRLLRFFEQPREFIEENLILRYMWDVICGSMSMIILEMDSLIKGSNVTGHAH